MRPYAVITGNVKDAEVLRKMMYPWVLGAYGGIRTSPDDLGYSPPGGIILDSGAFSAWSIGQTVDRDLLLEWAGDLVRRHTGEVRLVNLDVIPGARGRQAGLREVLAAAERSACNAEHIRGKGFSVVEVYHGNEPLGVLDGILDRRQPNELIAIGGMAPLSRPQKAEFCGRAFTYMQRRYGSHLPPVHGLGMAPDTALVTAFPWYSCDASSWNVWRQGAQVASDGRLRAGSAPRTTNDMRMVFNLRRLMRWIRHGESLTRLWESRGITYDLTL